MKTSGSTALAVLLALLCAASGARAGDACLGGEGALADPAQVATARATVDATCPCADYDGSPGRSRGAYQKCARGVADELVGLGLPLPTIIDQMFNSDPVMPPLLCVP